MSDSKTDRTVRNNETSDVGLEEILCGNSPDRQACQRFLERLQEAHENIRPSR